MENQSFMFLYFLKKNSWELKCQHTSWQLENNETQLTVWKSRTPSTSSVHLTGMHYGRTHSQGFGTSEI